MADARAWPVVDGGHDPLRALLLSAIACEVKVKTRLAQLAGPETAALVEIITSNPREVAQSVSQLLHKPYRAVTGRSLRDDDAPLHDEVELLFKRRNDAAHRGKLPPSDEAFNPVATASRLFDWLNAL